MAKHKAAIAEIAIGVAVVAVVVAATVATGGLADAVAIGTFPTVRPREAVVLLRNTCRLLI